MVSPQLFFSRDEATRYERVSVRWYVGPLVRPLVRWSVRWSVTLSLFGLLGATYGRVSGLVNRSPFSLDTKMLFPNFMPCLTKKGLF